MDATRRHKGGHNKGAGYISFCAGGGIRPVYQSLIDYDKTENSKSAQIFSIDNTLYQLKAASFNDI